MKKETFEQFLTHFDEDIHPLLRAKASDPDVNGLICFECMQLDSSNCGHTTAMVYGPTKTYKTVAEIEGQHLYDLPSQREYPISYWEKE